MGREVQKDEDREVTIPVSNMEVTGGLSKSGFGGMVKANSQEDQV